jgi:hypothetical protein
MMRSRCQAEELKILAAIVENVLIEAYFLEFPYSGVVNQLISKHFPPQLQKHDVFRIDVSRLESCLSAGMSK